MTKKWYEYASWPTDFPVHEWANRALVCQAIEQNKTALSVSFSGHLKDITITDFFTYFEEKSHLFRKSFSQKSFKNADISDFQSENTHIAIELFSQGSKNIRVHIISLSQEEFDNVVNFCHKHISPPEESRKSAVYMLGSGKNGLDLIYLGEGGSPLCRTNYAEEVIQFYDYTLDQFKRKDPKGRIAILQGSPGTGKSYLIRAFLNELTNAIFVIVPAEYVGELASPGFVPVLVKMKDNSYNSWTHDEDDEDSRKPIIFILEDADKCLVPRGSDNINSIGTLLNFGDGIMGSVLDVRIIATTNAKMNEIDSAITRPGRLCANVHVDKLNYEEANRAYKNIVKDNDAVLPLKESYSLAEIYNTIGENSPHTDKKSTKIGF